jgi:hypothetical protein
VSGLPGTRARDVDAQSVERGEVRRLSPWIVCRSYVDMTDVAEGERVAPGAVTLPNTFFLRRKRMPHLGECFPSGSGSTENGN